MKNPVGHIRSFVRRQGRITHAQQHALENYWPEYGICYTPEPLDLDLQFSRTAPKILDIGVGMGGQTIAMARTHPENDYLAVEVHTPGIGYLLRTIKENNFSNIRIINHDIMDVLQHQLAPQSLDSVCLFFPDPWPKKRHHKRRLVNNVFLERIAVCMKRHARFFIATDWQDYAEHIIDVFRDQPGFRNLAGPGKTAPRPQWRIPTRFEKRGENLQHNIYDFVFALEY